MNTVEPESEDAIIAIGVVTDLILLRNVLFLLVRQLKFLVRLSRPPKFFALVDSQIDAT